MSGVLNFEIGRRIVDEELRGKDRAIKWLDGTRKRVGSSQLDHHLADVLPLEQTDESAHRVVYSFRDRLLVLHLDRF